MTYSKSEKIDILEQFIASNRKVAAALRALRSLWNKRNLKIGPGTFYNLYKVFKAEGSVEKVKIRPKSARTAEVIEQAALHVVEASNAGKSLSSDRLSDLVGVSKTTAWKILRKDLRLKPYHIKLVHKLMEDDFDRRAEFCELFLSQLADETDLMDKIIWSDEAIFTLADTVNRHNCVYWDSENPNITKDVDNLGAERVMVWVGVWSGGRLGPYFFDGSVNGQSYLKMLREFVVKELREKRADFGNFFIFQQDGAPAHWAVNVRRFLDTTFDQWIGRRGSIEWPARSPDLTVVDFFLWGYLKEKVFERNPSSLAELKRFIKEEFHKIPQEMIARACRSVKTRYELCIELEGKQIKIHKG